MVRIEGEKMGENGGSARHCWIEFFGEMLDVGESTESNEFRTREVRRGEGRRE